MYTSFVDYSYPLLRHVASYFKAVPHDVGETWLVCCQHLLAPQKQMFMELISFGFDPQKILVLGKTYSTNNEVLEELRALGIRATQPLFSGVAFDQEHAKNCAALMEMVPDTARCILLDDGAQLIQLAMASDKNIWFAVEQTSSGFRKLENVDLPFPVLNVARSATKLLQESPLIARHACERMKDYFQDKGLSDPTILIVGLGPVGEAVRQCFEQADLKVTGFDTKHEHSDLIKTINNLGPDVVIGATGTQILSQKEILLLPSEKALYLISMSSSDREFEVAPFRNGTTETRMDISYKNITFVNNGFPISFKGNRYESLPIEMEKTMCLLGGAVMYGCTRNSLENGLLTLPEELEGLINA